nr:WD repeat-containing protein 18 isoform X1 [Saimiri boliviensis boliviensis]
MCPGPVTCLTTSPNGLYVLAGIAESIHLWEVSTGNLLVILSRHYQDVSCLQFTGDSSHFISGGKDCLVLAWSLCSVLQADPARIPAPRHVWSHHTLPITDLRCGFGGPLARVATSSLDQTVKLWEVSSGELLLSVLFDVAVMAVTMDLAEHHLFCGGSDGSIFQVDLFTWPGQRERSFQPEQDSGKVFKGHRNQVTCLSVSTDGSVLLSGSHDETVRLWDVQSKQCIRTVALKGPVTNATILLAPVSMLSSDFRPSLPLPHFNKHLLGAEHGDEPRHGGLTLRLGLHQQVQPPAGNPHCPLVSEVPADPGSLGPDARAAFPLARNWRAHHAGRMVTLREASAHPQCGLRGSEKLTTPRLRTAGPSCAPHSPAFPPPEI